MANDKNEPGRFPLVNEQLITTVAPIINIEPPNHSIAAAVNVVLANLEMPITIEAIELFDWDQFEDYETYQKARNALSTRIAWDNMLTPYRYLLYDALEKRIMPIQSYLASLGSIKELEKELADKQSDRTDVQETLENAKANFKIFKKTCAKNHKYTQRLTLLKARLAKAKRLFAKPSLSAGHLAKPVVAQIADVYRPYSSRDTANTQAIDIQQNWEYLIAEQIKTANWYEITIDGKLDQTRLKFFAAIESLHEKNIIDDTQFDNLVESLENAVAPCSPYLCAMDAVQNCISAAPDLLEAKEIIARANIDYAKSACMPEFNAAIAVLEAKLDSIKS